jgi:hypothetical protein
MKFRVTTTSVPVLLLLGGLAVAPAARSADDDLSDHTITATHLATAEVARVDARSGRLTLRTEGRTVSVDRDADSPSIRGLRPGARVIVGYRVERDARGHQRLVLAALHDNTPSPATRSTTVITGQTRTGRAPSGSPDWTVTSSSPVVVTGAVPVPVQPWTGTVAPPANATGIPFSYVTDGIPSVPPPTPTPNLALPPGSVAMTDADTRALLAARDFQLAAAQLAQAAEIIDRAWQGHVNLCVPGVTSASSRDRDWFRLYDGDLLPPDRDDCRVQREEITRMALRFREQVLNASSTAQAAGLLPGQVREVLVRYRIGV